MTQKKTPVCFKLKILKGYAFLLKTVVSHLKEVRKSLLAARARVAYTRHNKKALVSDRAQKRLIG